MNGSYSLYVAIGIFVTVLRVVGVGAIFAYGIIRGSRARRPLLFISGGLLLVSLIMGSALPNVLVAALGLGAAQAISVLSAVLDIAGIAVLMYAFVQADRDDRPSAPGPGGRPEPHGQHQQPAPGWQPPGPGHYPSHPNQPGQPGQGGMNWDGQGWNQH